MKRKIYFAGPLFCEAEKQYNEMLTRHLEQAGYEVFLPQRDGFEACDLNNLTEDEVVEKIFRRDTDEIKKADSFFFVLDGRVPDDGACVELGIAYASGKPCYGIKTDVRAMEYQLDLNPLIAGCFQKIFRNGKDETALQSLLGYLAQNGL